LFASKTFCDYSFLAEAQVSFFSRNPLVGIRQDTSGPTSKREESSSRKVLQHYHVEVEAQPTANINGLRMPETMTSIRNFTCSPVLVSG
jgi:hypothetical protein